MDGHDTERIHGLLGALKCILTYLLNSFAYLFTYLKLAAAPR